MRRRIRLMMSTRRAKQPSQRYTRKTANSTFALAIFTGLLLAGMVYTIYQQKGFNKKQLELYELSNVPLVYVVVDSLLDPMTPRHHNIHYSIKNVGKMPALGVRTASIIVRRKRNILEQQLSPVGVQADVFPNQIKTCASSRQFECSYGDTLYFHVRVDYQDILGYEYCYRATYYILARSNTPPDPFKYRSGMETSEFIRLGKGNDAF